MGQNALFLGSPNAPGSVCIMRLRLVLVALAASFTNDDQMADAFRWERIGSFLRRTK